MAKPMPKGIEENAPPLSAYQGGRKGFQRPIHRGTLGRRQGTQVGNHANSAGEPQHDLLDGIARHSRRHRLSSLRLLAAADVQTSSPSCLRINPAPERGAHCPYRSAHQGQIRGSARGPVRMAASAANPDRGLRSQLDGRIGDKSGAGLNALMDRRLRDESGAAPRESWRRTDTKEPRTCRGYLVYLLKGKAASTLTHAENSSVFAPYSD
jgi:hypothetical protein